MNSWFDWLDLERPQAIFTALLSVLIPLSIFVGRRNVRVRRLRLLDNLERVLFPTGSARRLPPGFDMIRARYLGAEMPTPAPPLSRGQREPVLDRHVFRTRSFLAAAPSCRSVMN